MNKALVFALCLLSSGAFAQTSIRQTGTVTPFDIMRWRGTNIADDPQNDVVTGRGVNPFSIYDNKAAEGLCLRDALTTSGAYHSLCLGHNAAGDATITIDTVGAAAGGCSVILNGTSYSCVGGGGNVSGPGSSTNNDFALWNGSSGNTLKNGNGVVVAHSGGLTTTDTTSPTTFTATPEAGFSSFVWKTPNLLQLNESATHIGQFHTTMAIMNTSTGSGANGPANDSNALVLGCHKTGFLTSAIEGEVGCLWGYLTQGARGDAGVYLADVTKVDDPTIPNYAGIVLEGNMDLVAPTTGTTIRGVHPVIGWGITGFLNVSNVAAGTGNKCKLTVPSTAALDIVVPATVYGIEGTPECNGNWTFTIVDGTNIELTGSVVVGTYTGGGVVGSPNANVGGPTFGYEARAAAGQNGPALLVSTSGTAKWGSALRVRTTDDSHVAFDMNANGQFVVQPPTSGGTMVDPNYSATFLNGPIRIAGNMVGSPRANQQFPGTAFPHGLAIGYNFSAGSGEVDFFNLNESAPAASFTFYQKTAAATQDALLSITTAGSDFATPLTVTGGGVTIGTPTGGYKGVGSLNFATTLWTDGVQGIATCSVVTAGATITITNGIITAFTGC